MGVGEAVADKKVMDAAVADLDQDHRPEAADHASHASRSRPSRSARAWPIGCKVTLRGARMYEFLDRLINIAMPRIRDFRGVSPRSFDGRGNYTLGVKEQIIFPEIQYDQVDQIRGHGHHHHYDGRGRQSRPSAARGFQLPVPEVTRTNVSLWLRRTWSSARSGAPKVVKKYAAKRAKLKELIRSPEDLARGARGRAGGAAEAAARCQPGRASAIAARSPAARAACTASSGWRA